MAFNPSPQFAFNRAYLAAWQLGVYSGWVLNTHANPVTATIDFGGGITQTLHFKVRDEVWQWSSNRYTLDFVIERAWNTFSFVPGEFDTTYNLTWQNGGAVCGPSIIMDAGGPTLYFRWNAAATPLPFWITPPSCPEFLG